MSKTFKEYIKNPLPDINKIITKPNDFNELCVYKNVDLFSENIEFDIKDFLDEIDELSSELLKKRFGIMDFEHTIKQLSEIYNKPDYEIISLINLAKIKLYKCIM